MRYIKFLLTEFLLTALLSIFMVSTASAVPTGLNLQGRLVKDDLAISGDVDLTVTITSPDSDRCLLYQETHHLNLAVNDGGIFSVIIGSGLRTAQDKGFSLAHIFSNTGNIITGLVCLGSSNTSYTPTLTDTRHIYLSFNTSLGMVSFNDPYVVQSTPFAIEAERLAGKSSSDFLQVATETTQSKLDNLMMSSNYTSILDLIAGTSTKYMSTANTGPTKLPVLSASPSSPAAGEIWYEGGALKYFDGAGSQVRTVGTTGGSVTSIGTGVGLTGGPITGSGTVSLQSGVTTPGTYKSVTVDTYGRVTSGTSPTTLSGYGITDAVIKGGQAGALTLGTNDANNLFFNTDNISRMSILSNGNVGIGTTNPMASLSLSGANPNLVVESSSSSGLSQITSKNDIGKMTSLWTAGSAQWHANRGLMYGPALDFFADGNSGAGEIRFFMNTAGAFSDTPKIVFSSSGNVGIGTTSPSAPLEASVVSGKIAQITSTNGVGGYLQIANNGNGKGGYIGQTIPGSSGAGPAPNYGLWLGAYDGAYNGGIINLDTLGNSRINFITDGVTRAGIDNSGNVGIGTTSPGTRLEVKNSSYQQLLLSNPSNQKLWMGSVADTVGSYIGNNAYYDSSWAFKPNYSQASGILFGTGGSTSFWNDTGLINGISYIPTTRMFISPSGNVGIGTVSPGGKIQVDTSVGGTDSIILRDTTNSANARFYFSAPVGSAPDLNINTGRLILPGGYLRVANIEGLSSISGFNISATGNNIDLKTLVTNTPVFHGGASSDTIIRAYNDTYNIQIAPLGGNVGIGTTSPGYKLDVAGDVNATGCIRASGSVLGGICSSDERLKMDVQPFNLGLNALLGFNPKMFKYNGLGEHPKSAQLELGVIAQDVEKTAPELIISKSVKLKSDDLVTTQIKQVNYTAFIYILINAVKEMYEKHLKHDKAIENQDKKIAEIQLVLYRLKTQNEILVHENEVIKEKLRNIEKSILVK